MGPLEEEQGAVSGCGGDHGVGTTALDAEPSGPGYVLFRVCPSSLDISSPFSIQGRLTSVLPAACGRGTHVP